VIYTQYCAKVTSDASQKQVIYTVSLASVSQWEISI